MKHKKNSGVPATFPLTIGTPYGVVTLELEACRNCDQHFNYRFRDVPPLLCTRQAEPFLWRLMNTLESIGSDMWRDFPPESVRKAIAADTYENDKLVIPSELN